MASQEIIRAQIRLLGAAYPQQSEKITPDFINLWVEMMADIPETTFIKAIKAHVSGSKWLPSVAEIREAAEKIYKHTSTTDAHPFSTAQQSDGLWEMAMSDYNDFLAGEIAETQLNSSKSWRWYQRVKQPTIDNEKTRRAEEIYQRECDAANANHSLQNNNPAFAGEQR